MTQTLAANWLNISINLLLVIHVIVCLLLALVVLMQRPKQEGLGAAFGGGVTDQAFGAQTTNVLQKGTVYLGTLFFVITLILAILIGRQQAADPTLTEGGKPKAEETSGPASDSLKKDDEDDVKVPGKDDQPETPEKKPAEGGETPESPEPAAPANEEEKDAATGAGIGAAAGAIIGEQSGDAGTGAVIGGAVGDAVDKAREKKPAPPKTPETGEATGGDQ